MQRGRGSRDPFSEFGDPFPGFGNPRSLMSSFFGGRDPFDDPFFTRPFGNTFGPSMFGPSMFGPSMFGSSMFGHGPGFLGDGGPSGLLEDQQPRATRSTGPVIEELFSGDEEDGESKKDNPRKHSRSASEPYILEPDEQVEEKKSKHAQFRNDYDTARRAQPHSRSFSFQSSTVTYGGANGAYYTSSATRKMGNNGVMMEEAKEADTTTGKATHRISKGMHDKGHSVTRKLNSDGRVEMVQTLHNLNEDELVGFEEAWKGNARKHLPGQGFNINGNMDVGGGSSSNNWRDSRGWALPSTERMSRTDEKLQGRAGPSIRSINIPIQEGIRSNAGPDAPPSSGGSRAGK